MKKIILLLSLPLLLASCGSNEKEPAYKNEFYIYLEDNFNLKDGGSILTVLFKETEANTYGYTYVAAEVYYTDGDVHKCEYIIAVDEDKIVQIGVVE